MPPISPQAQKKQRRLALLFHSLWEFELLLLGGLRGGLLGFDLDESVLAGEVPAALLVDLHELDPDHIADGNDILDLLDALAVELGDVDEAVLARGDLDERAELHQAHNAAIVELADLGHEDDIVDALLRSVARGGVGGGDVDGAVVVDVDLGAGIGNDLLDDAAALLRTPAGFAQDGSKILCKPLLTGKYEIVMLNDPAAR